MSKLGLLIQIAFRNLFASTMNIIVGLIIFVGTLMVVMGSSMLDSIDSSLSRSIIGSATGNLQVYSSKSKDEVAMFGQMGGTEADLTPLDDFARLKQTLESVPNVKEVVPMGLNGALVTTGNSIDLALERLRTLYRPEGAETPDREAKIASLKRHVRQMVSLLQSDLKSVTAISNENAIEPEVRAAVVKANTDAFWDDFDKAPLDSLEFLENNIAPLGADSEFLPMRYVGTDMAQFQKAFDRMEIVDGKPVPPGHPGMLLAKYFYEDRVKLKSARRLDKLKEAIVEKRKKIAEDPDLQMLVKQNKTQTREILFQLDDLKTAEAVKRLQAGLGSQEKDLNALLIHLFEIDDQNFQARYDLFYQQIAPLLELYRIRIGDSITIKTFTRTGYVQAINLPIYGTFQFNGLEKSPLAGVLNLMDLVSFRQLQGFVTAESQAEIEKLKAAAGAKAVDRKDAESELFGDTATVVAETVPGMIDESAELSSGVQALRTRERVARVYPPDEVQKGMFLNAAVLLKDPKQQDQTAKEIEAAGKRDNLPIKVTNWQKASGTIGSIIFGIKAVLYLAVFIIFVVTLVIINNSMMMATMQRVQEIGTLRAIGAQRSFVRAMLPIETLMLGLSFGLAGAAVASGLMAILHKVGIPANHDVVYFFFSGPRLHPTLGLGNLVSAFLIVLVVCILSSLYPAFLATRVSPVQAMQSDE